MADYGEKDNSGSQLSPLNKGERSVAVAIQGDGDKGPGRVVASGRGKLADEILALAFKKGIRVREDADLAEILATIGLDTPIPSEAIIAVAEILAKVYEANARLMMATPSLNNPTVTSTTSPTQV